MHPLPCPGVAVRAHFPRVPAVAGSLHHRQRGRAQGGAGEARESLSTSWATTAEEHGLTVERRPGGAARVFHLLRDAASSAALWREGAVRGEG